MSVFDYTEKEVAACFDCGHDTDAMHEYYMVQNRLWYDAVTYCDGNVRSLCIGCLERRLGFKLCADDFIDAPVNELGWGPKSLRLRDRLTRTEDGCRRAPVRCLP